MSKKVIQFSFDVLVDSDDLETFGMLMDVTEAFKGCDAKVLGHSCDTDLTDEYINSGWDLDKEYKELLGDSETSYVVKYPDGEVYGEYDTREEAEEARLDLIEEDLNVDGYCVTDYLIEETIFRG